mgnify:FL=1
MPELTDEFVKASTSYESIEDMKAKLRENIEKMHSVKQILNAVTKS